MIKNLKYLVIIFLASCCQEQINECPCFAEQQNPIYKGCEHEAVYDLNSGCGVSGMYNQLYSVINYPQEAREDSIQGTVIIEFDVFEDGSIGNYAAINDTLGYGLADAALEAVMTLSNRGFCPARENCTAVIFKYTLPIKFVLQ